MGRIIPDRMSRLLLAFSAALPPAIPDRLLNLDLRPAERTKADPWEGARIILALDWLVRRNLSFLLLTGRLILAGRITATEMEDIESAWPEEGCLRLIGADDDMLHAEAARAAAALHR